MPPPAAAGMTRGAFYSNFESKDDLIIAMLEDHVERSLKHHRELLAKHCEPEDFIAALLHIEMILFAARSEKRRPELAKRLKARRDMVAEILTEQKIDDPAWISSLLLALEDGFRLHRLVDPASTQADSFFRALTGLLTLSRDG